MTTEIELVQGDITRLGCDAIVNAANRTLLGGGGVDGAIHRAAGPALLEACKGLGGCETGQAKITEGYGLPARFVIHTVGPVWHGGKSQEEGLLASCYRNSLKCAQIHHLRTVAFPSISTGAYRFPIQKAAVLAVKTVKKFLEENPEAFEKVTFVLFSEQDLEIYKKIEEAGTCTADGRQLKAEDRGTENEKMNVKKGIFISVLVAAALVSAGALMSTPGYGAVKEERRVETEFYPNGEKRLLKYYINKDLERTEELFSRASFARAKIKKEEFYGGGKLLRNKEYYEGGPVKSEGVFEYERLVSLKEYYENGKVKSESVYKDGKLHGLVKKYYGPGQLAVESTYLNGDLEGPLKRYYENGKLKDEIVYKNGKQDGPFKEYYETGPLKSEKVYRGGKLYGPSKDYYETRQLAAEAAYLNGDLEGPLKEYHENGKLKSEVLYRNGKQDGPAKEYYRSGQLKSEKVYRGGKPYGLSKDYAETGQLETESNSLSGDLGGSIKRYYENGRLKDEAVYRNGKQEGPAKEYYKSGPLKSEKVYRDGKLNGLSKDYYETGRLETEAHYLNGDLEGSIKRYYPSGKIKEEAAYKEGKPDGISKEYYESGLLKREADYYRGTLSGLAREYDENGRLKDAKVHGSEATSGKVEMMTGKVDSVTAGVFAGKRIQQLTLRDKAGIQVFFIIAPDATIKGKDGNPTSLSWIRGSRISVEYAMASDGITQEIRSIKVLSE